ncbi:fumarate hydratase C-terminal domain-containing protein [Salmonella enterica subsp. enterica]|nr:fumarate hydratase C-terminal domain-containing protein [Salmonella enterica subsp. enterica]
MEVALSNGEKSPVDFSKIKRFTAFGPAHADWFYLIQPTVFTTAARMDPFVEMMFQQGQLRFLAKAIVLIMSR